MKTAEKFLSYKQLVVDLHYHYMHEINTIYFGNIRIDEPVVTITDLLVSFLCFLFYFRLKKANKPDAVFRNFRIYFFAMGTATLLGGFIGHAFFYFFNFYWKLPGWIVSMVAIMFIERAAIEHTRIWLSENIIKTFRIINIIEFLTFLCLAIGTLNFFFVEFHSGYGLMFVVFSLETFLFIKTKNRAGIYILSGIGFAALAATFFTFKISLHQWFNHMAISHIFMAAATILFYLGARKIDMSKIHKQN